jgi:hypothetical protein
MNWRWITANLPWKLGSLATAVVLWYAVFGEPDLVTSQAFPILFQNLPRDLIMGADVPDRVHLDLRGSASALSSASLAGTSVVIDLRDAKGPGERTFTISAANVKLPAGVQYLRAVPSQLRTRFDRLLTKEVPVNIRLGGGPAPGYRVVSQEVRPATVRIAGPEARVRLTESAQTDAVDISNTFSTAEFRVNAYVSDPQVRMESTPTVTVKVVVAKRGSRGE